jgi:hypothetical protein
VLLQIEASEQLFLQRRLLLTDQGFELGVVRNRRNFPQRSSSSEASTISRS